MDAQTAPALPATPEASLTVVGAAAEARAKTALERFERAVQSILDAPLDPQRVLEWTELRSLAS